MMTAVDTTIHYLTPAAERSSFGYPNTVIIRNPDTSDDCLFFLFTIFFFAMVSSILFFFLHRTRMRMAMAFFRARPQATVAPEAGKGRQSKTAFHKSPAGVFCSKRVLGVFLEFMGGKGWRPLQVWVFFFSVHSTAHGKPLVVDSSSYV